MAPTHKLSVVVGNFIALTCNFNVGIDNFRVAIGSFTTPPGKLWYSGANFMTSTYKLSCRGRQLRSTTCDFNVEVGSFTTPTYNFTSTARNFVVARACQGLLRHRTHEFHIDSDGGVIRPRRCRQSLYRSAEGLGITETSRSREGWGKIMVREGGGRPRLTTPHVKSCHLHK
jgi:hypothetical protein